MDTRWADEHGPARAPRLLAALALVASLEAACGGQAEDPAGMPQAPPSAPMVVAPQPTSAPPPATSDGPPRVAPPAAPATPPAMSAPSAPAAEPAPEPPITPSQPEMMPAPEPAASIAVYGCLYIGGYDRVFFYQKDDARGICAELVLVTPEDEPSAFDLTGLSLPPRWSVEEMSAFRCTPDWALVSGTTPNDYRVASGSVAFGETQGGLPLRATVAVTIAQPAEDADHYPDLLIMGQEIRADDLELQGSCPSR